MRIYFLECLLFLSVICLIEGCPFSDGSSKKAALAPANKKPSELFFDEAQAFAKNDLKASALLEKFEDIKKDPKELSSLLTKKVDLAGSFQGYSILHLLARGEISAPVIHIFQDLLLFLGENAKKVLDQKAQDLTAFMIVRQSSLRVESEDKEQNLALARLIIEYDRDLINDESFSFADRNYLLRRDKNRIIALFRALSSKNAQAWDAEAAADPQSVKDILKPLMQLREPQKRFYKNILFSKAKGKALDHSDDQVLALIDEWQSYGFNSSDWLLDDFSYDGGPAGKFLAVYAYALGDIRSTAPLLQKKFVDVVDALKTKLSDEDYARYARLDKVKGTLHDRTKTPGFHRHAQNAIGSASAAARVLRLSDAELYRLAKKAVRKGGNDAKHRAYQDFSASAQEVQKELNATYFDHVAKDVYGRPAKTVYKVLKRGLSGYPGYAEHLLNIPQSVDAALVFKACASNKVEASVVKWLYAAAVANDAAQFNNELLRWLGANALQHRKEFKRLFESGIDEQAQTMLKNSLVKTGLSYQKLVEDHDQFGLKAKDLKKDDWESSRDPQKKSTLLNAMAEKEQGRGLKSFVKMLSAKAFKAKLGSRKWLDYKNEQLDGKTAAEHAAPNFLGDGARKAERILLGQKKPKVLINVPLQPIQPIINQPMPVQPIINNVVQILAPLQIANPMPVQQLIARPQRRNNVAQNMNIFQQPQQANNAQVNPLQQFHQAQLQQNVQAIPRNIVADTKNDLDKLKLLATKSWHERVKKNPDKAMPAAFVRKPIDQGNVQVRDPLVAVTTKNFLQFSMEEQRIDAIGQKLKEHFSGIRSQSAFNQSLEHVLQELKQMGEDLWRFLVSQQYFWANVLSNMPGILNELNPEQILWLSTAVANQENEIALEAQATIHRLIAHIDIEKDHLVQKRIEALIPAAQVVGASLEDRLLEKLAALKKNAATLRDEGTWDSFDAQVQEIQGLARARNKKAQALLQNNRKEAKALALGLLSMDDDQQADFEEHLIEFLPSGMDHQVGDALTLLSRSNEQLSDLLFAFSDHQLHQIFARLLDNNHIITANQGELLRNLLRGLPPNRNCFLPVIEQILGALAKYNGYPAIASDLADLDTLLGLVQGAMHAALNRYEQKSVQHFDRSAKVALLEQFNFMKHRLAQWKLHSKDINNQELLEKLKDQEPRRVTLDGNFGQNGKREASLEDPLWFASNEAIYWQRLSQGAFVLSADAKELDDARDYLAQFCAQVPFLPVEDQRNAEQAFLALLDKHSERTPVLDFIYKLKHEHEVAILAEKLPKERLVDLVKYLHVGDNVPHSTFKHAQMISSIFFSYLPDDKALLLIHEPKFWELLGSQSEALGFALSKDVFAALTLQIVQNNPLADEQNLARALAKMEIDDGKSAEIVYEKHFWVAKVAEGQGLKQIEKEILSKTSVLQKNLAHDGPRRVQLLKNLL